MLYIVCPTCNSLLGDRQDYYERELKKITEEYLDGKISKEKTNEKKEELIKSLGLRRYCCRMRVITYQNLVDIIV
jgi:DNA-directed RNA polymerase subunit N (RpoN/RPB10)